MTFPSRQAADLCGHGRNPTAAPTRNRYEAYIQSATWRSCPARLIELALAGRRCRLCRRGEPEVRIEVHHNSYERLGSERPQDLCCLCGDCHAMVTSELRRRRYASAALPPLVDAPRALPGRMLIDRSAEAGP